MLRGPMRTDYKLAYICLVWMIYDLPDSEFYTNPAYCSTALHFKKEIINVLQGKENTFNLVVPPVYDSVEEIRKMYLALRNEGKEVHFLGPVTDKEKLVGRIIRKSLSVQMLTINEFIERSDMIDTAIKDPQFEL